jgi:HSP20 family protein
LAIVRWNPASDLAGLHSAMDRLFGDMFGDVFAPMEGPQAQARREGERPTLHLPVNIKESQDGYTIEAPVPGFKPEDVQVTFADGVLTIEARRSEERREEKGDYVRREVSYGNYRRRISLPGDIRADDIRASFEDGVLRVEVPRAPRPQPRKIEIKAAEEKRGGRKQMAGDGSRKG